MFYEKNTQALLRQSEIHQGLVTQLNQTEPTEEYALFPTPDGNYTLQYKGVFLHDPENPLQEVEDTLQTNCTPSPSRVHGQILAGQIHIGIG